MEFIVIILLFVVIGTILTAVPLNKKKKVSLTKQNNTHNSSPLFSYSGSNHDSVYDGSSYDCGGSFGGDSGGSCGGGD
jgi:hypothetical protein